MDEGLLIAEQIVRLLRGPQGRVWELVEGAALGRQDGGTADAAPRGAASRPAERLRPRAADVAIRDAQGGLIALARPTAA